MTWDQARVTEVADAYEQHYVLSQGDRAQRLEAEKTAWAWEAVEDGVTQGTLPVQLLDALLHHPGANEGFRGYVAAGPIEDALSHQPGLYAAAIAERCAADAVWADAAAGVWLSDVQWAALPPQLQRHICAQSTGSFAEAVKAKRRKRPSKRQSSQPRRG